VVWLVGCARVAPPPGVEREGGAFEDGGGGGAAGGAGGATASAAAGVSGLAGAGGVPEPASADAAAEEGEWPRYVAPVDTGDGAAGEASAVPPNGYSGWGGGGSTDGCASQEQGLDDNGCFVPWWGTPLEGTPGLLHCPGPNDPAILAYGQTNRPPCWQVSGPVDERVTEQGLLSCCYHLDERACCGSMVESELCIDVPYFGEGGAPTVLPDSGVDDPTDACAAPVGEPLSLSLKDKADALIGIWLACGPLLDPFAGDGFVFHADGSFDTVTRLADGRLVANEGCSQSGLALRRSARSCWSRLGAGRPRLLAHPWCRPWCRSRNRPEVTVPSRGRRTEWWKLWRSWATQAARRGPMRSR